MNKFKTILQKVARKLVKLEQPFHLAYLGPAAIYYAEHGVKFLAFGAGGLFVVTAVDLLNDLFGGDA